MQTRKGCDLLDFDKLLPLVLDAVHRMDTPLIVAIDGRCASGKSTLGRALGQALHAPVIPMDDFFLRPVQRTAQRLATPGENVDWERFRQEVLLPLSLGQGIAYRPFDCAAQRLGAVRALPFSGITLVEGSYSCHSALRGYYGLKIFLTTDPDTQAKRILSRNGAEKLAAFQNRWIPLEERYFAELPMTEFDFIWDT